MEFLFQFIRMNEFVTNPILFISITARFYIFRFHIQSLVVWIFIWHTQSR
ncbi:unnamed protein product [Schistosoma curassoni]|uniref:Uncharacterized protein n=1 Tax=Schistosoma curassoni TaxID=6186 RepID=A0A183JNE2_9TREM|nr:unnamed protein product [Schistosoma curassoni]